MHLMPGRRTGIPIEVTKEWLLEVALALDARGWDKSDLARAIDVSAGIVSRLMRGELKSSTLVIPISVQLGIHAPGSMDPMVREIAEAMRSLSADRFEQARIYIRRLADVPAVAHTKANTVPDALRKPPRRPAR